MAEAGLDVGDVVGSGRRGQILKGDVAAARKLEPEPAPAPSPEPQRSAPPATRNPVPVPARDMRIPATTSESSREERVKMTRLRQTIALRLKEAQNNAAMLTTFNDADMTAVMAMRAQYKELFEKKQRVANRE